MKRYFYLLQYLLLPFLVVMVLYDVFLRGKLSELVYAWKYEIVNPAKVTWQDFRNKK